MSALYRYTQEHLVLFERLHGVTLPKAYREALISKGVSEGATMWDGLSVPPLSWLEGWQQPGVAEEFVTQDGHLTLVQEDLDPDELPEGPAVHGMRIVNLGCEMYVLMTVAGDQAGTLSLDCSDDRSPAPLTVLGRPLTIDALLSPLGGLRLRAALFNARWSREP